MKTSRIALLLATSLLLSCARRLPEPTQPEPANSGPVEAEPTIEEKAPPGLRFQVEPADAEVFIDEKSYGEAAQLGHVPLPPGIYRVSIRARGYTTWRAEVSVGESAEVLKVSLPPRQ